MELHEIIDRTYEGDVQAFSEFASRYRDMAFGYALTFVDREQTAEDVVQESLVLAYANMDRLRQPRAFGAWLRGIVRHQCYRTLRAEPPTVSWDAMIESPEDGPHHFQNSARPDLWDEVKDAIDDLTPAQREVVQMHYESGLSQQEIAACLGATVATVNMRLHAARSRLKRRLKIMTDPSLATNNPGRIQQVDGGLITVQFAPNAMPPIGSKLTSHTNDVLCVVQHLSGGRIAAACVQPSSIWTPGQEVTDSGIPFTDRLDSSVVVQIVDGLRSPHASAALVSGIKTVDVFAPLTQSGTTGIFTEWGLGVLVLLPELMHHLDKDNNRQTILVFIPPLASAQHWKELTAEITIGSRAISIMYLPVADPIKQEFIESVKGLDSKLVLSRHLSEQAIWPCIDPLACRSRRLDEEDGVGDFALVAEVKDLLRSYYALQFSIDPSTRHTLSPAELEQIQRARKALRYLSQPFFVAEPYTKRPGVSVSPEEAKQTFADILAGKYDSTHRDAFYMTGAGPR